MKLEELEKEIKLTMAAVKQINECDAPKMYKDLQKAVADWMMFGYSPTAYVRGRIQISLNEKVSAIFDFNELNSKDKGKAFEIVFEKGYEDMFPFVTYPFFLSMV